MPTTTDHTELVTLVDAYCASVAQRALVSGAEFVDHLLDLHIRIDGDAKAAVEGYLREFSQRELLAGSEATDALLDIRAVLAPA